MHNKLLFLLKNVAREVEKVKTDGRDKPSKPVVIVYSGEFELDKSLVETDDAPYTF